MSNNEAIPYPTKLAGVIEGLGYDTNKFWEPGGRTCQTHHPFYSTCTDLVRSGPATDARYTIQLLHGLL
jgi:hypothetical protein